jgi:hypothetical protein
MATTVVPTLKVTNISKQLVKVYIQPKIGSSIFNSKGGYVELQANTSVEAESNRFDQQQLAAASKNGLISFLESTRTIDVNYGGTN